MIGSPLRGRDRSPDPQLLEPGELTPVHQRSSRRLRGDPPEFGPLPAATTTQAITTADTATMTSPATSSDLVATQALEPWLLTPVPGNPAPGIPECKYNKEHTSMRNVVEMRIEMLKSRFRYLQCY
ncbi:hypothetical protein HPB50_015127 [Hyalomma asiaticum]|uniref:Uncharacterized protein n=1 Tax=Hyalomma asiaticum TaxID=266040 RepID=A0ACB7SUS2_HYAAI|nr:hypothetical protein HPB50_015127 [Hyalomma asiaticum]